jgi:hypothetical protein
VEEYPALKVQHLLQLGVTLVLSILPKNYKNFHNKKVEIPTLAPIEGSLETALRGRLYTLLNIPILKEEYVEPAMIIAYIIHHD